MSMKISHTGGHLTHSLQPEPWIFFESSCKESSESWKCFFFAWALLHPLCLWNRWTGISSAAAGKAPPDRRMWRLYKLGSSPSLFNFFFISLLTWEYNIHVGASLSLWPLFVLWILQNSLEPLVRLPNLSNVNGMRSPKLINITKALGIQHVVSSILH